MKSIDFSIIIPTYNEEKRKDLVRQHLESIKKYFKEKGFTYEIIIVLDGPTDNTKDIVEKISLQDKNIHIINRKENKGKGYSLREGFKYSSGNIVLFTDMDGATPIHMLDKFLPAFKEGYDIVIGSRGIETEKYVKKHQPKWKEFLGNLGKILIQKILGLKEIQDTQCGFKAFRATVAKDIWPKTTLNRWGIDFEVLALAKKKGYNIKEIPVEWYDSGTSLVSLSGYFYTLLDLIKVKWRMIKK